MGGGILQLVAVGAQDIYITGNPQITFFKIVYRRYTNFSMETKEIPLLQNTTYKKNFIDIPRYGDLITRIYLKVTVPEILLSKGSKFSWIYPLGFAILKKLVLEIGGSIISEDYNIWALIWASLSRNNQLDRGLYKMLGIVPEMYTYNNINKPQYDLYILLPLYFFSPLDSGLALPLIALQYHNVRLNMTFQDLNTLCIKNDHFIKYDSNQLHIKNVSLLVNYIYLDSEERRVFSSVGHEYLIQIRQSILRMPINGVTQPFDLNFNHPTKELYWVVIRDKYITDKQFIYYPYSEYNTFDDLAIQLLNESTMLSNKYIDKYVCCPPLSTIVINNIRLVNNSNDKYIVFNSKSLLYKRVNYIDKIKGVIILDKYNGMAFKNISNTFTIEDLSIPTCKFVDTRFFSDDPHVNVFHFGMNIDSSTNPINYGSIQINGVELCKRRDGNYFNYVLPDGYHRNTPIDGVNIYNFALKPEDSTPSGTINFSRIDSTKLLLEFKELDFDKDTLYVFCLSYNILRVMSGMAGVAFSN